jgi:predicted transcriptional regulator
MSGTNEKEIIGAWIIHHGRKLVLDANGPAEFPAIDEAAKAATLLTKLGQSSQAIIPKTEVRAIAVASGLNPRHELAGLLQVLEKKRLIEQTDNEVSVLGVTTRGSLGYAADIYQDAEPTSYEQASIGLAEITSDAPVSRVEVSELIGDEYHLTKAQVSDFLNRAEEIGFVDKEGDGVDRLLFNGNLFRRESVVKTQKVLASLTEADQRLVREIGELLSKSGCITYAHVESVLSKPLFEKLVAAGVYDLNKVTNEQGSHVYVTSPSAFHKFVDPMVDDCFDMAKSLVAALTYGTSSRSSSQGRITFLPALLGKLIAGGEVGPTTSIGQDYRVLEVNRVVKLRPHPNYPDRYFMKLLKTEIGQLALHVLTQGNAYEQSLTELPSAPMSGYVGPEDSRTSVRKKQSSMSKRTTRDVLEAVRGGRAFK